MRGLPSNKEWEVWGEIDPLFGVATWKGKEKDGTNPWTTDEFYEAGRADWSSCKSHWEKYGLNSGSCLEIGCGAGRVTVKLATYFDRVHAVDISQKMIEFASQYIASKNVTFHLSDGIEIPLESDAVDAVFSTFVFQHLDSLEIGARYFKEIARVMRPGGSLMIHMPVYQWPAMPKYFDLIYRGRRLAGGARALIKRRMIDSGLNIKMMRGTIYPTEFFYEQLPKLGLTDIELSFFRVGDSGSPASFVFARKNPARRR